MMSITNEPTARIGLLSRATSRATTSAAARNTAALTTPARAASTQNPSRLRPVVFAIAGLRIRGVSPPHLFFGAAALSDGGRVELAAQAERPNR